MNPQTITTIAVHDGTFHADDVFAAAILLLINPKLTVVRSRNPDILAAAGFRIDVGGKHSAATGDFDHHMTGGAGKRANGIPYAACGLIWKKFGPLLAPGERTFEHIDRRIVQTVDAIDSGYETGDTKQILHLYTIADAVDAFNPAWNDADQDADAAFMRAVSFAQNVMRNELRHSEAFDAGRSYVSEAVAKSTDPRVIILERYCPWQEVVVRETAALFVIFPSSTGDWRIRAVPDRIGSFVVRRQLPKHWGGLSPEQLAAVTGVEDATFCHQGLFIAGAASREGVMKLLEIALR
jgi:uncharacterized UPF0160 family protein